MTIRSRDASTSGELAAQLHPEPGDLDREARRLEHRVQERGPLGENVADAFRRRAILAKLSEEGLDPVKGVVAPPVKAPVDEILDQTAQRAEGRGRHQRRARRRPRRAAAHRYAEQERRRRPRAHQHRGEYRVRPSG